MDRFLFVLGSNWQLSLAELDSVLKNSQFKGTIIDYSANIATVEFDTLHEERHYINKLMELQFILGGCQKIAKIFDFIDIQTIYEAFPLKIDKFRLIEGARNKIGALLNENINKIFPQIRNESLFFAVSIYPNLFDEDYYSQILVKHFLPYLSDLPFDGLEALTPEPQGDVTLEQIQEAVGNKVLLDVIPSVIFLPEYSLSYVKKYTQKVLEMFSPRLIVGVSDEMPPNGDMRKLAIIGRMVKEFEI